MGGGLCQAALSGSQTGVKVRMITRILMFGGLVASVVLGAVPASALPGDKAIMQGLDKVTARISTFEVALDQPIQFGALQITLRHCDRAPPEDPPEAKAYLEILEARADEAPISWFQGWMFASTPALSALEHPVYDVWVKECIVSPEMPVEEAPKTEN